MVLLAGPLVAIVGIVAIFFVLRRKSVEKRSMYSARREQIEHKVRAARQRTLTHGHAPKAAEQPAAAPAAPVSAFDQPQVQPTVTYQYQAPAYEAPPIAPPAAPKPEPAPSGPMPWETPSTPAPTQAPESTGWDFPPATATPEPYVPAPPAPAPRPAAPSEPVWTPAPRPAEPMTPAPTVAPAASSTAAGAWSVVSSTKEPAATDEKPRRKSKDKGADAGSPWQLASGDAPGVDAEEVEAKRPSGTVVALAQYAVLVVGLVMVLIGVLVMVANSHVT